MRLTPNCAKIIASILFVIEEGERRGSAITQYDIVKTLWDADVEHLNTYGRPITFDNYAAMEHGPVPSLVYEMLMPEYRWPDVNRSRAPWLAREAGTALNYGIGDERADLRVLSKSDRNVLLKAFDRVLKDGFWKTRERTHQHPAWRAAWEKRGLAKSRAIDYALLLEAPDREMVEHLAYASAHA